MAQLAENLNYRKRSAHSKSFSYKVMLGYFGTDRLFCSITGFEIAKYPTLIVSFCMTKNTKIS